MLPAVIINIFQKLLENHSGRLIFIPPFQTLQNEQTGIIKDRTRAGGMAQVVEYLSIPA
jgi:hypothetical protein